MSEENTVNVYPDGSEIKEYPKWIRNGELEVCVASKEEEDKILGKVVSKKEIKGWGK